MRAMDPKAPADFVSTCRAMAQQGGAKPFFRLRAPRTPTSPMLVVGEGSLGGLFSGGVTMANESYYTTVLLVLPATRWSSTISSKVDLPHAINFRALCGVNLITLRSKFRANETPELHRVDGRIVW